MAALATLLAALALAQQTGDVPAILAGRCLGCHNSEAKTAGLDLSTRDSVAARLDRIRLRVEAGTMPPAGKLPAEEIAAIRTWIESGAKYPEGGRIEPQRKRAGLAWWSLQPLRKPAAGDSIDSLLRAKLATKGLVFRKPATRRTLIRRATFDLLGLPPTPEEVAAFEGDTRPDAYERLLDRLLASPHYGERWGRHWLDVARFGESHGYEQNHLRSNAYPYRDWVIRAFNTDKPFDRMVLEQLAGDQIAPDDPDANSATGFLVAGVHDTVGNQAKEAALLQRANDLDDIVTATGAGFLGLTFNCARCHDHKFDPIQQKDYYRLAAIFAGTKFGERPLAARAEVAKVKATETRIREDIAQVDRDFDKLREEARPHLEAAKLNLGRQLRPAVDQRGTEETVNRRQQLRAVRMRITGTFGSGNPGIEEIEVFDVGGQNAALASKGAKITASSSRISGEGKDHYGPNHMIDGRFGERWFSNEKHSEITIQFPQPVEVARIVWSTDRLGGNLTSRGGTPVEYVFEGELASGSSWILLSDSRDRLPFDEKSRERMFLFAVFDAPQKARWESLETRRRDLDKERTSLPKLPMAYIGVFEQPTEPEYLHRGGNPSNRGEAITADSPSTLRNLLPGFSVEDAKPEGERRLALARWIVDPRNALTARVLANRVWHYHFGRGIVGTPSDFGRNGEPPDHPELLDYLAAQLQQQQGWKLKPLHREILLSEAYRQSSDWDEAAANIDADDHLLWRFPPRRLEAEALRDSVLAVSGALDRTMFGPGFQLYRYTVDNVATYLPKEKFGPETYRRSVYHQAPRSIRVEMLSTYDCPDPSLPEPRRVVTTTALQALDLLNNGFMIDQSRLFADRLQQHSADPAQQADLAFRLAFGRPPEPAERTGAVQLIQSQGLFVFCRAILNANEFVYVM